MKYILLLFFLVVVKIFGTFTYQILKESVPVLYKYFSVSFSFEATPEFSVAFSGLPFAMAFGSLAVFGLAGAVAAVVEIVEEFFE